MIKIECDSCSESLLDRDICDKKVVFNVGVNLPYISLDDMTNNLSRPIFWHYNFCSKKCLVEFFIDKKES